MNQKEIDILEILEKNGRLAIADLAKMVDLSVKETEEIIEKMENGQIILKYLTVIDWQKVEERDPGVTAMIDVKVTPKRDRGFDDIAERIYRFPEVQSVYLMSGAYDLSVVIEGKTLHDVSRFVSDKLSALDSVVSTTTHFIMKKYKHDGTIFGNDEKDRRIVVAP